MSKNVSPAPWRFIAVQDYPDAGILRGDVVSCTAGRPTRLTRQMPVNAGLILNLHLQDILVSADDFIGTQAVILEAMERADRTTDEAPTPALRVVR